MSDLLQVFQHTLEGAVEEWRVVTDKEKSE